MNTGRKDVYSLNGSRVDFNIKFWINTVLPPVEEATHSIRAGSFGIISNLLRLYLYSGMSIGSTLGMSSLVTQEKISFHIMDARHEPRRLCDKYLETIEEIQEIEKIVIQDTKLKRCCTASLELLKAVLEYLKNLRKVNE